MPRTISSIIALLLILGLGACSTPSDDFDFTTCGVRPRVVLPIDVVQNLPIVHGRINNAPASFILDTGAESVVLTSDAVRQLSLKSDPHEIMTTYGAGGQQRRFPATLHDMELGSLPVPDHLVPVLPTPLPVTGAPDLDGLLGVTILSTFELELDFPRRQMTLYAGRLCPAAVVPNWQGPYSTLDAQRSVRGRFIIPVTIDGKAMNALVDTGTQASVVTRKAANEAGLTPAMLDRDPAGTMRGAGPDPVRTHVHRFAEIRIGDEVFTMRRCSWPICHWGDVDAILGMDYLASHRPWLSYARKRVFIAQPEPRPRFPVAGAVPDGRG
jgi:predicted aspartyl protease